MNIPNLKKPFDPRFSCGPTKKPEGWSLEKFNDIFLGRYHRSDDVKVYVLRQLERINKILKVPYNFKTFLIVCSALAKSPEKAYACSKFLKTDKFSGKLLKILLNSSIDLE